MSGIYIIINDENISTELRKTYLQKKKELTNGITLEEEGSDCLLHNRREVITYLVCS